LRQLDFEKPTGAQGVGIGQGGIGTQGFIDLDDFAPSGHVHIGGGFDRLDDASDFAGGKSLANGWQIDKHDVSQGVLGVHGDAHDGRFAVFIALEPSVVFGVLDGHGEQQKSLAH
jgi:hypothetical protein